MFRSQPTPRPVPALTSLWSLPWRWSDIMSRHRWLWWPLLTAYAWAMQASPLGFTTAWLAIAAQIICFSILTRPKPLTESDVAYVAMIVKENPQWQGRVAKWLSLGPLDYRHVMSLSWAWCQVQSLRKEEVATACDQAAVQAPLRQINDGGLGALADQMKMERNTPAARPTAAARPRQRL